MIRFRAGDLRISVLDAGEVWLDGGAMFGVVPKPLWERLRAPDEKNRIRLAMNVLLVEDGKQNVLIDTGAGTRWEEKQRAIYRLTTRSAEEILAPAGLRPDQIDLVVDSHLHFDHAGGNTSAGPSGEPAPAFPNAVYVVQRGELEFARSRNERVRASYMPDHFEPIDRMGRFRCIDGEGAVTPWMSVRLAPGHTPFLHVPVIATPDRTVAFLSDLVPTSSHVPYPYIMGYDLEPLVTLESKKRILPEAAREKWWVVFEHDAEMPLAQLDESGGRLVPRSCLVEA